MQNSSDETEHFTTVRPDGQLCPASFCRCRLRQAAYKMSSWLLTWNTYWLSFLPCTLTFWITIHLQAASPASTHNMLTPGPGRIATPGAAAEILCNHRSVDR